MVGVSKTFDQILKGDFKWLMRARIRISFEGQITEPVELHDQFLSNFEHRYYEHVEENRTAKLITKKDKANIAKNTDKYPNLAFASAINGLNYTFLAKCLSPRNYNLLLKVIFELEVFE